jgi:hypothetical protein
MTIYFIYYFLLDTIFDIFSHHTTTCITNHPHILLILILHHLISSFLLVGWLFNYKSILLLHIFVVIGTIIYWRRNENLCGLTTYVNNICGWDHEKPFHDLLDIIGLKRLKAWNEIGHYIFILVGACISLYKITRF